MIDEVLAGGSAGAGLGVARGSSHGSPERKLLGLVI